MSELAGVIETYLAAGETFVEVCDAIEPSRLTDPALGVWDLRSLVGHTNRALLTVATYLSKPRVCEDVTSPVGYYLAIEQLRSDDEIAERGVVAGKTMGADPGVQAAIALGQAKGALARVPAGEDPVIPTLVGGMRLSQYLPTRTFELVAHSYDIAQITGARPNFPKEAVRMSCHLAADLATERGRGMEMLLSLLGRVALSADFSLLRG